jgi:hypothetical protein
LNKKVTNNLCTYHREFSAEDEISESTAPIKKKMASTYMAMNMKRHVSLYFLPLCHHFISVQFVGPSLQLQENPNPFSSLI